MSTIEKIEAYKSKEIEKAMSKLKKSIRMLGGAFLIRAMIDIRKKWISARKKYRR